jgi:1,4-dihydroxy-2-naphthoyl-CoA hydrolase
MPADPASVPLSFDAESVNQASSSAFLRAIGLHFDHVAPDEVRAHLVATEQHHTPWGVVHGGVYAAIVESVGTIGAVRSLESTGQLAVGVNNQIDFLRPHRTGRLEVRGTPIQQGKRLQLWQVEITNAEGKLVARGQVRLFNQPATSA